MSFRSATTTAAFSIFALYAGLLLSLFYFWDSSRVAASILSERTFFSVKLSVAAATAATLLSLTLAVPAAYALSRFEFRGKVLIDTMLELPMIVSPAALGAMLLIFFNNPAGTWVQEHQAQFVFTTYGIVLAQFVTTLGVSTRLVKAAMDEIPSSYEDVARTLGASPLDAFCSVTLPLSKNGILAAAALTWAKALGEFGATITIGGSMAMKTETLPVAIFMRLATADIEGTVALILLLTTIGLALLFGARLLTGTGKQRRI